ncbi:hypothetical protein FJTKL_06193 [Diaporthe vaccinii]|uniref:BTB domain-containing protein n=1 Tax=Diaporthe vaccinii TaxID=105482 RepID=A0ABR4EXN3_9PEZI
MDSSYEDIISSDIFTFMVGPNGKEYNVHDTAISRLSKPLGVLINGDMREAKERCVKWPDVDEKTFVRFVQWAYTKTYITEEPEILLDHSIIGTADSYGKILALAEGKASEMPLYSLTTANFVQPQKKECCWNKACGWYGRSNPKSNYQPTCLVCRRVYTATACANCNSIYTDCPTCGPLTRAIRSSCSNNNCNQQYFGSNVRHEHMQVTCLKCRTKYSTRKCPCGSTFSDCGACAAENGRPALVKRLILVHEFLDASGTTYPTSTSAFSPRKNTEGCEDYTGVFLCHAKLYVVADKYDIPALKQLSLHRLHATLKEFTLYPSRMNDIATLAKYVFENTVPEDKIRDMITMYYACIVEDARKQDGLKSLIDEIPNFAFDLIDKMSDRLD